MRGLAPVLLSLVICGPALAQDEEASDALAAPPDHVSLTNAKLEGSPPEAKKKPPPRISSDELLLGSVKPTVEQMRAAIRADVARDPSLMDTYGDLLNPGQDFEISEGEGGRRVIFYVTPDHRGFTISPD